MNICNTGKHKLVARIEQLYIEKTKMRTKKVKMNEYLANRLREVLLNGKWMTNY